jgi:PadR family transcriptional regulator, regulatory protein PadR
MPPKPPRMTGPTRAVLELFLGDPDTPRYGLEIGSHTGLPSGTVHPILARLEGLAWLDSGWEDIDPTLAGRPRRRFYRLTAAGAEQAEAALAAARARRTRLTARRPAPASPRFGTASA